MGSGWMILPVRITGQINTAVRIAFWRCDSREARLPHPSPA
jgi:hypothetical protein